MRLALGIDSGAHSGISLLSSDGGRPRVEMGLAVWGTRHESWLERATSAFLEARKIIVNRPFTMGIEEPPQAGKASSLHGDPRGQRTWQGMGRRRGMLEALCFVHLGLVPQAVPQSEWTSRLAPLVAKKKLGEGKLKGQHRIREAILLIDRAKEILLESPESCRVDLAESMLVAMSLL